MKILKSSERISNSYIKDQVILPPVLAAKINFVEYPAFAIRVPWLAQWSSDIKPHHENGKIKPETDTCTHGHFPEEVTLIQPAAGFIWNIFWKPYIPCISKGSQLEKFPEIIP